MASMWCIECRADKACGDGHVYALELHPPSDDVGLEQGKLGYLYVGSTSTTVEERHLKNFMLKDGTVFSQAEAREQPVDTDWWFKSPGMRKIRSRLWRPRPDLLAEKWPNPIALSKGDMKRHTRFEAKLAARLERQGWDVTSG